MLKVLYKIFFVIKNAIDLQVLIPIILSNCFVYVCSSRVEDSAILVYHCRLCIGNIIEIV